MPILPKLSSSKVLMPDESPEEGDGDESKELEYIAEDVLNALQSKSIPDLAKSLKAFFECLEASPRDESLGD